MIPMQTKLAPAVVEVVAFMAKTGLALADLIEVGGEDLESSNPRKVEKAKRVEKCWSLMASLGVKFADLENSPQWAPEKSSRKRCGEGHFSQVVENTAISEIDSPHFPKLTPHI